MGKFKEIARKKLEGWRDKIKSQGIDDVEMLIVAEDYSKKNPESIASFLFMKYFTSEKESEMTQVLDAAVLVIAEKCDWN